MPVRYCRLAIVIAWLLYEKCLALVKQLILKQQSALKRLMEMFSVKVQEIGVN
jgi:hypothetical protein